MAPDYIKTIAEEWVISVIDFAKYILLEDDITYRYSAMITLISKDTHGALQEVAESAMAIRWITEFQKFKYTYATYPNKLNNLLIIAVYIHCRNIETAEYIVRSHLYRHGHTIFSEILKKNIVIDEKFVVSVNEFYKIWNHVER